MEGGRLRGLSAGPARWRRRVGPPSPPPSPLFPPAVAQVTKVLRLRWTAWYGIPVLWPAPEQISKAETETDAFDASAMFYLGLVSDCRGRSASGMRIKGAHAVPTFFLTPRAVFPSLCRPQLLIPLVIGLAVYSLLYTPQKSWYSWCLSSLANGRPLLCKSDTWNGARFAASRSLHRRPFPRRVRLWLYLDDAAALCQLQDEERRTPSLAPAHVQGPSWADRARCCPPSCMSFLPVAQTSTLFAVGRVQAFNTFIDDVFSWILTMPMSHRIACLRDDVVFFAYLYQRWYVLGLGACRVVLVGEGGFIPVCPSPLTLQALPCGQEARQRVWLRL